jgi:hypothetical protein
MLNFERPIATTSGEEPPSNNTLPSANRRKFLGQMGAAIAVGTVGTLASPAKAAASVTTGVTKVPGLHADNLQGNQRVAQSFAIRLAAAQAQAAIPIPTHLTNGDQQRYPDGSGTYTKVIEQESIGLVNPTAYASFLHALSTGNPSDFENIIIGGTRTLNGPQGGLAYTLEGTDSHQFGSSPSPGNQSPEVVVPPAPALSSAAYGTELMELYWASLLRDVAFTDFATSPIAAAAAAELNAQPTYAGPRDSHGHVTPANLFRGALPGETIGPYLSQFIITPTAFGALPITQQYITYVPNVNYMMDPTTFQQVQNGVSTGLSDQTVATPVYQHNGRSLAAFTHVDVLYEAYFMAYLVLDSLGVPLNPGNPYVNSRTQNGFDTFGQPDIAATLAEVAARALDQVWFQKWFVHLRHRPESGGGLVYLTKTGQINTVQGRLNSNILNSQAVRTVNQTYDTWFLPQAFPEGSPSHPSYPTGHGTVAGACITILKFFFDGNYVIPNPVVPSDDGSSLEPYTGSDAGQITVNGELAKLAHNISFGHGIHAGIHWRSDTDISIQLGEAFAISFLQDKARVYNEKFTIQITKIDGTTATISNQ